MNRQALLLAAVGAALGTVLQSSGLVPATGGLLGAWRLASGALRVTGSGEFVQVPGADDVFRLDLWWRPLPVALAPLTAVLVRDGANWVLIDAGASDNWSQSYASRLAAAVQRAIPEPHRLHAILLTHGHFDHVGALPHLLQRFPDVPVIVHADGAPFLTGQLTYLPPDSVLRRGLLALRIVPGQFVTLPAARLTLLHGAEGGSLAAHGVPSISWVPTPGHTPGHTSYLHRPSGALVAGDAMVLALPSVTFESGIEAALTLPLAGAAGAAARLALAPAQAALRGLLGGGGKLVNATLSGLSGGRLTTGAATALGGRGENSWAVTVAPAGAGVGQEWIAIKRARFLPGLAIHISPAFVCRMPYCDQAAGERSICHLAGLRFTRLLPAHDATGKGLAHADVAAFCAALPPAAQAH